MKHNILTEYRELQKEVKSIDSQIKRLEFESRYSPSFNATNLLSELKAYYTNKYEILQEKQLAIEKIIDEFEPIERDLIRYRFFNGLKWEKVFIKLSYSQAQTFRIYRKILKKLKR